MRTHGSTMVAALVVLLACGDDADDPASTSAVGSGAAATTGAGGGATTASGSVASAGGAGGSSGNSCPPTGPGDVGVVDPSLLVDSDRIMVSESGTLVENVHVHGDIEIVEGASDVTIRNFRITTDGYWGIFVRDGSRG